jgi:hypothetical protein
MTDSNVSQILQGQINSFVKFFICEVGLGDKLATDISTKIVQDHQIGNLARLAYKVANENFSFKDEFGFVDYDDVTAKKNASPKSLSRC